SRTPRAAPTYVVSGFSRTGNIGYDEGSSGQVNTFTRGQRNEVNRGAPHGMESTGQPLKQGSRRFLMNAGRTTKQGQQISSGKDHADYQATVGTMTMHPDDMKETGVPSGSTVRVTSPWREATCNCTAGKLPQGMI